MAAEIDQDRAIAAATQQRKVIHTKRRDRFRRWGGHRHDPAQDRGRGRLDAQVPPQAGT